MDQSPSSPGTSKPALACPHCGHSGKPVDTITVQSMVVPSRMMLVKPKADYYFCAEHDCPTVYFTEGNSFTTDALREAVYQKDDAGDVPVCYCFGWTRGRILTEIQKMGTSTAVETITGYVKADKCACEIRNPQGNCCLGNVSGLVKEALDKK